MADTIDDGMASAGFTEVGKETTTETNTETAAAETNTEVNTENAENTEVNKDVQTNTENTEATTTETTDFNIESFNKAFGGDSKYENIEQVRELIELSNKYPELKAQLEDRDKVISERDETIKEQFNPMSYFADEQQFTINQVMKNNPDLNKGIINRIATANLDELSDKDVLKFNELLNTRGTFDDKIVELSIEEMYGLNVNKEDMSDDEVRSLQIKEYRMKKDAESARVDIQKLLTVDKPEFKDPTVLKQERDTANQEAFDKSKEAWEGFTKNFVEKDFTKFNINYQDGNEKKTFEFDVDAAFSDIVRKNLPAMAAANKKDLNNETDVAFLVEQVQKDFLWVNKDKILKNAIEDVRSKMTKEEIDKYHNPTTVKKDEAPITVTDEDRINQETRQKMIDDFKQKK